MPLEIKITTDGSPTIYSPELNEHYHSVNGAYTESMHVFINAGLLEKQRSNLQQLNILEVGLGTGLNLMLTNKHCKGFSRKVLYHALEPFPLNAKLIDELEDFDMQSFELDSRLFRNIHEAPFDKEIKLPHLNFYKFNTTLEKFSSSTKYDLIYFDAFGPQVQPEIWSKENFLKLFETMHSDAILVTYCAKGAVRRTMQSVGFTVERIPGPPGKREMLRATKK